MIGRRKPVPDAAATAVASRETGIIHAAAAQVLSYPTSELLGHLDLIEDALADLSGRTAAGSTTTGSAAAASELFAPLIAHLRAGQASESALIELQSFHVQEFDLSRRHAMHLTYWTDGDTRRRGETLARIKQIYRDSGLLVHTDGELCDYLPMVCEFVVHDPERGLKLLADYRPSIELLRMGCTDDRLPHAGVLEAICASVPGPRPTTRAEVQAMVDAATPSETVGIEPQSAFMGMPVLTSATREPSETMSRS